MNQPLVCPASISAKPCFLRDNICVYCGYVGWRKASEQLPSDNQVCDILSMDESHMLLGIVYKAPHGWLDMFATPEAGELYTPKVISYWRPEQPLNLPRG